jgi:hypothetical protein
VIRPALAVSPFAVACYFIDYNWTAKGLLTFMLQMVVLAPALLFGAGGVFMESCADTFNEHPPH